MLKQNAPTRNIELRISYVGTQYSGWQVQPHSTTVQGLLQLNLRRVLNDPDLKTSACSRTDTGVHAHDQHVSFKTPHSIPLFNLMRALNHGLPADIRVWDAQERDSDFSARYHARAKHYAYFFYNKRCPSPFISTYCWNWGQHLDHEQMQEASSFFVGTRCFKALQASDDFRDKTETTITATRVVRDGDFICFEVLGHHFLYHMVRNMFGAIMRVGLGEWNQKQFRERLNSGKRKEMWLTAPAKGLHLMEVFYSGVPTELSNRALNYMEFLKNGNSFWGQP